MKAAFSPCPNDTLLFYAWVHNRIETPLKIDPHLADIEQLNKWAIEGLYPLVKLSFATLAKVCEVYELLPVGAALGENCGPKIIGKEKRDHFRTIAIPGELTTAHLLFDRLELPYTKKVFCRYDEVFDLLSEGKVDTGLIIHESRFTFKAHGFVELADLGELWGGLIPLGGLAIRRDFPQITEVISTLRASLAYSEKNPTDAQEYILTHAQEKDPSIVYKHIETYVNGQTKEISPEGMSAIERLIGYETDFICPNFRSERDSIHTTR
ncbi:MAG: 1,4-dihydroxy-6-naphtoate synthase [Chlamydiales bacterium]|nr:1,4-dihydroxy-6-naphtoate synthase [Chlamydiales bacterium]MCH9620473.1 1,4-dihydroxy-6-naphtoate synthase [Chlamydiales bacterium]MCH9623459.1 1,4-dihydroxy-6-naphtoate synthase [Chlamydiales bacterium]